MSQEKMIQVVSDALTNEVKEIELSDEDVLEMKAGLVSLEQATQAKASARTSALAKLAALGLTEEEIAAL